MPLLEIWFCLPQGIAPAGAYLLDEENADTVFQSAYTSVVSIVNSRRQGSQDIAEGTGSGLVWDAQGHIVTNYHCIAQLAKDKFGTQVGHRAGDVLHILMCRLPS